MIVATGRELHGEMAALIADLSLKVTPLTEDRAHAALRAYVIWGKGYHRAKLNICDSFAYALAREFACPLLYVGNDFAQTDVVSALSPR